MRWRTGLRYRPGEAKAFYGALTIATVLGACLNLSSIDPVTPLYWSATIDELVSVPIMLVLMVISADPEVMGDLVAGGGLRAVAWLTSLVLAAGPIAMLLSWTGVV